MELGFSVRQLSEATKLPTRLLQFWTDHKVLEPILGTVSGGRGVHRLYSTKEVEIATVLAKVIGFRPKVQVIKGVAHVLRDIFQIPDDFGFASMEEAEVFLRQNPQTGGIPQKGGVPRLVGRRKVRRGEVTAKRWREEYTGLERRDILAWIAIQRARRDDGFAFLFVMADGDRMGAIVEWAASSTDIKLPQMGWWSSYLVVDLGDMTKRTIGTDLPIDEARAMMRRRK